ncbi:MOSC domain-containing protein [Amycolatopsis sp. FDAARGOS 1241]|uniref:MOSC domain-containing protein n=1 Tax=Amycolatopsis sp. FDAARGOS 1241 TaxID=2778070 RepID=UPI0019501BA8|nr:MOSC domain-containing protein [Amycolatopsis sp. FDAARGOS 1241]QRP46987.1 MOSC domain-containing protein [Amycolatopsis sp. FDAARGOS 1241]
MTTLELAGVFVGRPAVLGRRRERPVRSAIVKGRVAEPELELTRLNLDGDEQADLKVHGGVDKAVYAYPAQHYPAWTAEGFDVELGAFGENLAVAGADESEVRIGDVWEWGDARLQVSQPRQPCFKLAMRTGRKDVVPTVIDSGRCGWYLRVLEPGRVPTAGALRVVESDPAAPTVEEVHLIAFANFAQLEPCLAEAGVRRAEQILETPALSRSYSGGIRSSVRRWRLRNAG